MAELKQIGEKAIYTLACFITRVKFGALACQHKSD